MRITLILITGILLSFSTVSAQIYKPVKWTFEDQALEDGMHQLVFNAAIDEGWHLYSQFVEEGGPIPTKFYFETVEGASVEGDAKEEGDLTKSFDDLFGMDVAYFSNKATFTQIIKVGKEGGKISGYVEFMVCDDTKCLPPDAVEFSFDLPAQETKSEESPVQEKSEESKTEKQEQDIQPQSGIGIQDAESGIFVPSIGNDDASVEEGIPQSGLLDPVKWTFSHHKLSEGKYELIIHAAIEKKWHVYSQHIEGGAFPTTFLFDEGEHYQREGEVEERSKAISIFDKYFDTDQIYFEDEAVFVQTVSTNDSTKAITGSLEFMACDDRRCIVPQEVPFVFDLTGESTPLPILADVDEAESSFQYRVASIDPKNPVLSCGEPILEANGSLWSIFFLGMLGGFLALLTPCVFPMIPLTVSFFTKKDSQPGKGFGQAVGYGLSILIIYILLSIPFHFLDAIDPEILNTISTNIWLNVLFFIIFVVFAISFFGYFELTLPNSLTNKINSASNIGGILGTFFMALTLAFISFSCTGPILGSLLAGSLSSEGGAMQLSAGFTGFGLALALPFGLFAAFPSWLNSLPRSGSWMETIKIILGFVELTLAVKFLSNADMVGHWGILKREIFIGLWIIIGLGLAFYLLGRIKFPHDIIPKPLPASRWILGALSLAWVMYLIPGLSNTEYANRKLISGFTPPLFYSIYEKDSECPLGLPCYKDYEEGLAYAQEVQKPVILDFTGWACANCRRMEENVWTQDEIYTRLRDDYVLISLYVDDRKSLPEEEQKVVTTSNGLNKRIRTIGNKWATFQAENFSNNSQPYYVLLSPDQKVLNYPVGFTPEVEGFRSFLDCGLNAYQQLAGN